MYQAMPNAAQNPVDYSWFIGGVLAPALQGQMVYVPAGSTNVALRLDAIDASGAWATTQKQVVVSYLARECLDF